MTELSTITVEYIQDDTCQFWVAAGLYGKMRRLQTLLQRWTHN